MIVPWSLIPVGEQEVIRVAGSPVELTPPEGEDVVAVGIVIESPPLRAAYLNPPSFARRSQHGILLTQGEHILPIITDNPLQLVASSGTATVSLLWLARRP